MALSIVSQKILFQRQLLQRCSVNLYKYSSTNVDNRRISNPLLYIPKASELVEKAPKSIKPYLYLMRVDKPIGTWLLYWPCTWSIGLGTVAGELPSLYMLGLFGAGAVLMRSAGCIINDLWDKDFDKRVERTKNRPLAAGELTEKQAITLLGGLLSASLGILLQLNWLSVAVGASSMILVVGYPLAKRYTYWPQFILGATLNWGVLISGCHMYFDTAVSSSFILPLYVSTICYTMVYDTIYSHQRPCLTFNYGAILGYISVTNQMPLSIIIPMYVAAINWTLVYDTIYAHQDKKDDIMIGVKSTALRFGDKTKTWLSAFSAATISGLALSGFMADQAWPYYLALLFTSGHLAWQVKTVDINSSEDCWKKFKSNHYLGGILFAGIVAGNLLK
uniref:4-hydroxybenzoate polyprenyltransferase, mitochondrial n=1 Tax=Strongyloides venezuelensis TaxID=75913 RepID=A0A0K0FUP2_STRVS